MNNENPQRRERVLSLDNTDPNLVVQSSERSMEPRRLTRRIETILSRLEKKDQRESFALEVEILEPVKKKHFWKTGDIQVIPQLLGVRVPHLSGYKNLSRDLKGHREVGRARAFMIPGIDDPHDDDAGTRIVTVDGRVFDEVHEFVKPKGEGLLSKEFVTDRIVVLSDSERTIDSLPVLHKQRMIDHLHGYLKERTFEKKSFSLSSLIGRNAIRGS